MQFRIQKKYAMAALLASLNLNAEAAGKLAARITFVGRSGFPAGVNSGRVFRGGYSFDQFWQLVLLFHLQRAGIGLAPAIALVREGWPIASSAIWSSFSGSGGLGLRFFWIVKPAPLHGFEEFQAQNADESHGHIITIALEGDEALQEVLPAEFGTHFCLIDASAVVTKAREGFARLGDAELMRDLENAHRHQQTATTAVLRAELQVRT